jgi:uncharacterized protein YegL
MPEFPGKEVSNRPLHFIWIADCSGSMSGAKIQTLNTAIRNAIPAMRDEASKNINAQVLVRAVKFSNGAQWHIATSTKIEKFTWKDLSASGLTDMGKALGLVADVLKIPPMEDRALPPVLVLLSDGQPTDNFDKGLKKLLGLPWGKKAVRIAIAIGDDAKHDVLEKFIDSPEIPVLQANNAETLTQYIRWASTAVLKAASHPHSQPQGSSNDVNVAVPAPPAPVNVSDVW